MDETFEPLDSAEAVSDAAINSDDARSVNVSDGDPGLDSERPVLLEDVERRVIETTSDAQFIDGLEIEETTDPADQ